MHTNTRGSLLEKEISLLKRKWDVQDEVTAVVMRSEVLVGHVPKTLASTSFVFVLTA